MLLGLIFVVTVLNGEPPFPEANCTLAWCCEGEDDTCQNRMKSARIVNATTDTTGRVTKNATCGCECSDGWFGLIEWDKYPISVQGMCDKCSGHGLSFNYTSFSCGCETMWEGSFQLDCDICPAKYDPSTNCDSCNDIIDNSSFPACDVCNDGYFVDPRDSNDPEKQHCLPASNCTVDYCKSADVPTSSPLYAPEAGEGLASAEFANGECTCKCKSGWFGGYEAFNGNGRYVACSNCNGNGAAYDPDSADPKKKCTCRDKWQSTSDAGWLQCQYCNTYEYAGDCNQCADDYSGYPDCAMKSAISTGLIVGIVLLVVVVIVLKILMKYNFIPDPMDHCCRKKEIKKKKKTANSEAGGEIAGGYAALDEGQ